MEAEYQHFLQGFLIKCKATSLTTVLQSNSIKNPLNNRKKTGSGPHILLILKNMVVTSIELVISIVNRKDLFRIRLRLLRVPDPDPTHVI